MDPGSGREPASSSRGNPKEVLDKEMEADDDDLVCDHKSFYAREDHRLAYKIPVDFPTSKRGMQKFMENPQAYMASQIKRRQVEVKERHLTPEEANQFAKAKDTEVRNFLAAECFQKVQDRTPPESQILGMRWLLTWKYDEKYKDQGGRKPKARAIVLGYQDPKYEHRKTSAPTPTKSGRQLFFQFCAWNRMRLAKGDISGAFLQGGDLEEEMWCRPVSEICAELGVK